MQVVHGHERQAAAPGERLGGGEADQQRADQARALGDGDGLDVVERGAGFGQRLPHHGEHELEVVPRCDLGHDPAEARVQVGL